MAMLRQMVQRYGGFSIRAMVVRVSVQFVPQVTRTAHFGYTDGGLGYTCLVTMEDGISGRHARKIYFSPEENIFSSGGKKLHPLWMTVRLHGLHGYTVTRGYVAFEYFPLK